jgi:ATP-binding protein involved in chromosome partitioning
MGSVPLSPELREAGDAGEPLVISHPDSPTALEIARVAEAIVRAGESLAGKKLPFA